MAPSIGKPRSSPTPPILAEAKRYVKAGFSLIPIRADGTKMPAFDVLRRVWNDDEARYQRPWKQYKSTAPTRQELREWFGDAGDNEIGLAIIGGAVSGGLEIIDCDNWDVAQHWSKLVRREDPELFRKLVRVKTPRPGLHAYYRCASIGGNQKLARIPDLAHDGKKPKTIIEIKGEGGYCLAPPSPGSCHPSGRPYELISQGDLTQIATITPHERELLLRCARKLNLWKEPERTRPQQLVQPGQGGGRPGDDFNARADWGDILKPHGWIWVRAAADGSEYWRRPGKAHGISASTNFAVSSLLYVFSSNAPPFEADKGYSKFAAYALLNHDGYFHEAAQALSSRGYGRLRRRALSANEPLARYAKYSAQSLSRAKTPE